jgi:hypothetical protein
MAFGIFRRRPALRSYDAISNNCGRDDSTGIGGLKKEELAAWFPSAIVAYGILRQHLPGGPGLAGEWEPGLTADWSL